MTNANQPLPYTDNIETIPVDEADDIERVVQAMQLLLERHMARNDEFVADVYVKAHGYAEGELRELPNLPKELAQGLFENGGVYKAVVRFSNAASKCQSDALPDGRGMAIKLLGVNGEMVPADEQNVPTQDFVMINHPVFFARNVKDFLRLERVLVQADDSPLTTAQEALATLSHWKKFGCLGFRHCASCSCTWPRWSRGFRAAAVMSLSGPSTSMLPIMCNSRRRNAWISSAVRHSPGMRSMLPDTVRQLRLPAIPCGIRQ